MFLLCVFLLCSFSVLHGIPSYDFILTYTLILLIDSCAFSVLAVAFNVLKCSFIYFWVCVCM